jgi:hypothetical protein
MKKRYLAALATSLLAAICAASGILAGPYFDYSLSHYPGSVNTESERLEWTVVPRGGIARQATYQTADDLTVVTRWYAALVPGAEMHATSDCVSLWQSRVILHVQRSIGLRLCQVRSGTRIVVNERVDIWP